MTTQARSLEFRITGISFITSVQKISIVTDRLFTSVPAVDRETSWIVQIVHGRHSERLAVRSMEKTVLSDGREYLTIMVQDDLPIERVRHCRNGILYRATKETRAPFAVPS